MISTLRSIRLNPKIRSCSPLRFQLVQKQIRLLELDNRQLQREQFLTICGLRGLEAFGRIRKYEGFSELCSLGVVDKRRGKGLGRRMVKALVEQTEGPLYLVSIIPAWFETFGFKPCSEYPPEIAEKLAYCTGSLPVPEPYVVMLLN